MNLNIIILLCIFIIKSNQDSLNEQACLFAVCECNQHKVNCRGFDLTSIPAFAISNNKTQYTDLSFSNNFIEYLDGDQLTGLNLQYLWLRNNGLQNVSINAFRDVIAIQSLSFQANLIQNIEAKVFDPIKNSLKVLNLNLNELQEVPDLSYMSVLTTYNLSYNQISQLESSVFPSSLKILSLNNNNIEIIGTRVFEPLYNLEYLYLQFNSITSIDQDAFQNLHNLIVIDLSHNSIKKISTVLFYRLHNIEYVLMDHQHESIEHIEEYAFDMEKPRNQIGHYIFDGNTFNKLDDRIFCRSQSSKKINNNDIISFNDSYFNNINPCIFERLSSSHFTVSSNISTLNFDCDYFNHFLNYNLNLTFKSENKIYDYNNCQVIGSRERDVCARVYNFNCFDMAIFMEIFQMDKDGVYKQIKITNTSESMLFNAGSNLRIDCIMQSYDNDMVMEVEWRYGSNDSSIIETNENNENLNEIYRKIYTRSLYFRNVQRDSMGSYLCIQKDNLLSLEFNLTIHAVPTAPIITDVLIYEFRSYIKWKVEDFGGLDVWAFHLDWRKNSSPVDEFHTYTAKITKYEDEIYIPFRLYNTSIIRIYLENKLGFSNKSNEFSVANKQIPSERSKCMEELREVFNRCLKFKKYDNEPDSLDSLLMDK